MTFFDENSGLLDKIHNYLEKTTDAMNIYASEDITYKELNERQKDVRKNEENFTQKYLKSSESDELLKQYKRHLEIFSQYIYETYWDEDKKNGTIKLKKNTTPEELSLLEKIIRHESNSPATYTKSQRVLLKGYYSTGNEKYLNDFLESTENEAVKEADFLPPGILGMYIPATDTIYIARSLTGPIRDFVIAHEKAHRRRAYAGESQNEEAVDAEARAASGIPVYRN